MYKIAINALGLKNNTGGVETYIYNLIKHLVENDKVNKYYFFVGKNISYVFKDLLDNKNLKIIEYPVNTNNSTMRVIFENSFFALDLIKYKINLVHHVCNYMPKVSPVKSVTTLHDMMAFYYHENYNEYKNMDKFYNYFKKAMAYTAKKAYKIIVTTEYTKKEFLKYYSIDENKIIKIGISLDTRKIKTEPDIKILDKFNISKPYLLSVSVIRPHKNFDFLVKVFNQLKKKYNIPHQLVIAGSIHYGGESFLKEIEQSPFKDVIKYIGYAKDEELSSIYNYADAFIYPSLNEGFGIPLLEAMEYNIPVISSDRASLPEVGGDACLYFDPTDENDACDKIYSVLFDEDVKSMLIKLEKAQLEKFAWDKIAESLINEYNMILNRN